METFEPILIGLMAVVVLFWFWPGVKQAMKRSREAENPDWQGALIPIALVVLFIVFLIAITKG